MRTPIQNLQRAMNCLTNKMYADCFDVLRELRRQIETKTPTKHLKLLPQFIDKVADGTKTIHIKKRPLPLGVHEIMNSETGEPTGIFVRITMCKEETTGYAIEQYPILYKQAGFRFAADAIRFYSDYLKNSELCYFHLFERVAKPETRV